MTVATDEQALAMMAYVAIHRTRAHATDLAWILSRSPHWIGGRRFAVLPTSEGFALFDLIADEDGRIESQAVAVVPPNDGSRA